MTSWRSFWVYILILGSRRCPTQFGRGAYGCSRLPKLHKNQHFLLGQDQKAQLQKEEVSHQASSRGICKSHHKFCLQPKILLWSSNVKNHHSYVIYLTFLYPCKNVQAYNRVSKRKTDFPNDACFFWDTLAIWLFCTVIVSWSMVSVF